MSTIKLIRIDSESQSFVDAYEKVAQSLKGFINVGAVDYDLNQAVANEIGVSKVPTIVIMPYGVKGGLKRPIVYDGNLDANSVSNFATSNMPDFTHRIIGKYPPLQRW